MLGGIYFMYKILYVDFPEQMSHLNQIVLHSKETIIINKLLAHNNDIIFVPFSSIVQ
jgi:hypothetical protein